VYLYKIDIIFYFPTN